MKTFILVYLVRSKSRCLSSQTNGCHGTRPNITEADGWIRSLRNKKGGAGGQTRVLRNSFTAVRTARIAEKSTSRYQSDVNECIGDLSSDESRFFREARLQGL